MNAPQLPQSTPARHTEAAGEPLFAHTVTSESLPMHHKEPLSIDEIITMAIDRSKPLPEEYVAFRQQIEELHSRLAYGRLHLAVVGEFNRGKSTFINSLIGYDLLPTSVLPVTSVPTQLIFGRTICCTVAFLNDKPPLIVSTSIDAVRNVLLKYVAEEHNPGNTFGVQSVEVTVPAPLLENGTVLIDTPGFGSTYQHNTQTALGTLNDCDAVLFLLSSDPPVTQTEIEFLKMVVAQVPRIFFILNKIDLLTGSNLEKVHRFVCDVLMQKLRPSTMPHIFPISARNALCAAEQNINDQYWKRSGMETVKKDIISFMAREKYFTLSQALNDKLREAVQGITTMLIHEREAILSPRENLQREKNEIAAVSNGIHKRLEHELSMINAEKKAIFKYFDDTMAARRLKLIRQIHEAVDSLLNASTCSAESLRSITIAVNRVLPDAINTFKIRIIAALNRPLKRAIMLHGKEFAETLLSMQHYSTKSSPAEEKRFNEKLEVFEIDQEDRPEAVAGQLHLTIHLVLGDHFFGRKKKISRLHTRYDHQIDDMVKNNLFAFTKHIKGRVDGIFDTLSTTLTAEYEQLCNRLDQLSRHKEDAISDLSNRHANTLALLSSRITSFEEIMQYLH